MLSSFIHVEEFMTSELGVYGSWGPFLKSPVNVSGPKSHFKIDCKTVVFFANASDAVNSNERSGASVKTERENGERR